MGNGRHRNKQQLTVHLWVFSNKNVMVGIIIIIKGKRDNSFSSNNIFLEARINCLKSNSNSENSAFYLYNNTYKPRDSQKS